MRWLYRSVTAMLCVAMLSSGCGSSAGDRLVLRFVRFDNTGLTQEDAVGQNSADVDVPLPDLCIQGATRTIEPFTETAINAVFRNEGASDIHLTHYSIRVGGQSGLGTLEENISTNIAGGTCSNVDRHCALDADCAQGSAIGTCGHSETVVSDIVLFDFSAKEHVSEAVFGQALTITVTFSGVDDTDQTFQTSTNYVVTFADFNNCPSSGGTAGLS